MTLDFRKIKKEGDFIRYNLIKYCEIDKFAIKSYNAIHGTTDDDNLNDITNADFTKLPKADLIVGGSPCQDFSIAGNRKGSVWECKDCGAKYNPIQQHYFKRDVCVQCGSDNIDKSRSSLLIEYLRAIRESLPKFLFFENVKNIIGKQNKPTFDLFVQELREYGYKVYYQVLNAKNYGVPQNRERIFVIGIRNDIDKGLEFPEPFDNGIRLKDILEEDVDEKYYLNNDKANKLIQILKEKGILNELKQDQKLCTDMSIKNPKKQEISNCILSRYDKGISNQESIGVAVVELKTNNIQQIGNISTSNSYNGNPQTGRVYDPDGISPTLNTCGGGQREPKILVPKRTEYGKQIRKQYESGEIKEQRKNITELRPRKDGITNKITTVQKDNLLLEGYPMASSGDCYAIGSVAAFNSKEFGCGYVDGISKTLKAEKHDISVVFNDYRIRKLTPKECWRLMGFSDQDYQKAQSVNSNSQLYKQAGNSIVVDVLFYIFKNLQSQYPDDFKEDVNLISLFSGIGAFEKAIERL